MNRIVFKNFSQWEVNFGSKLNSLPLRAFFKTPEAIDWRDKKAVNEIVSQNKLKPCGSCYAFASIAALESHFFIKTGKLLKFSEQEIVDCSGSFGCYGGSEFLSFQYMYENGIGLDKDYPYKSAREKCRREEVPRSKVQIRGYLIFTGQDKIKRVLAELGPVVVRVNALPFTFQFYKSGIYDDPLSNATKVNHAVVLVGYGHDKKTGLDFWIVRNSWSRNWGENGYMKLAMNSKLFDESWIAFYPLQNESKDNILVEFMIAGFLIVVVLILMKNVQWIN